MSLRASQRRTPRETTLVKQSLQYSFTAAAVALSSRPRAPIGPNHREWRVVVDALQGGRTAAMTNRATRGATTARIFTQVGLSLAPCGATAYKQPMGHSTPTFIVVHHNRCPQASSIRLGH